MIIDAHMHVTEKDLSEGLAAVMERDGIKGLVCGADPEDAARVSELIRVNQVFKPSYGLHPWQADKFQVIQMESYYKDCAVIGEIGMDSVWCQVDLKRQRQVFGEQLEIAQAAGKPVLLHTKGQEREVARMVKHLTVPIILHWYSSEDHLQQYMDLDCYFTVGPDAHQNKAVQQLVDLIPLERLLVESDGLSAVEWALGRPFPPKELKRVLESTMTYIADIKQVDLQTTSEQMVETAFKILGL